MRRRLFLAGLLPAGIALPAAAADGKTQGLVLAEINGIRARRRLAPLVNDPRLARAALLHSQDMVQTGRMSHQGRDGSDPGRRLTRVGYAWTTYRENVAVGVADPRQVVAMWMNSAGHRENMLAPEVTQMGVGYAEGRGGGWTMPQYWTLILAAPR